MKIGTLLQQKIHHRTSIMSNKPAAKRDLRIIVIGAGMAGILAAIKLREQGFDNVTLYEKAARVGGTWRENTYPGLSCDVPSHSYTYSFAPNPDWSRTYPPGAEVQDYFERIVIDYRIESMICFNEEIIRCEFKHGRWHLEMRSGLQDQADIVIAATGVLHHPKMPDIAGLENFKGTSFHSSRWDHSVPLDGRRIGVVGNGSTGVQIICALANRAEKIQHFQRTAQWIFPIENLAFTEEQKAAFRSDPALLHRMQNDETYLANVKRFTDAILDIQSPEFQGMAGMALGFLEQSIADPVLREKLRPHYHLACKRLIWSGEYYQAIQHPNAELINAGIDCIEASGIRTIDGQLHELDLLVLATGFKADQFMRPMHVTGRHGVKLNDVWAQRPRAYLAISIPEFPNFFMLNGPTSPVGNFSLIDIAEHQWRYIAQLIDLVASDTCQHVEASQQALDVYDEARIAAAKTTVFGSGCSSWYLDAQGVPSTWPWSQQRFYEAMREPQLDDFLLSH
jgi:cation diffusion facilitator CzcD-associated flavoprotein CzcO